MEQKKRFLKVDIDQLRLRTIIGANESEREKKQDLIISVQYKYDAWKAIQGDDIQETVNYKRITKHIIKLVEESSYNLIETLGERIHELVSSTEGVKDVTVRVEKPHALRFCDNVFITISDEDNQ